MSKIGAAEKPLIRAARGERLSRPPFWLMRQAGRYLPEYRKLRSNAKTFLDLCYSPDLAIEATMQPIRRFAPDGAIIFSDILVVPHALGQGVRFEEGRGPLLDALTDPGKLDALDSAGVTGKLAPVYEAIAGVAEALPASTALIGFAGAPWTVATYMVEGGTSRDFSKVKEWAFGDPDGFERLIDILVTATVGHLDAQIKAGAEVIQLFESWAGILPAEAFRRWCVAPVAAVVAGVKARHPDVPIIAFPRGCGVLYEGYRQATGIDVVSLDATVPLDWAARVLQKGGPVQGNLDPVMMVVGGAAMKTAVEAITSTLCEGSLIFNLGHGVLPHTPPEHVEALANQLRA